MSAVLSHVGGTLYGLGEEWHLQSVQVEDCSVMITVIALISAQIVSQN